MLMHVPGPKAERVVRGVVFVAFCSLGMLVAAVARGGPLVNPARGER
jgi:hypothetical protein